MSKKNALGRGLDALITYNDGETKGSTSINEVELSKIVANPDQPRRLFDEDALEELAASIRNIGLIQPITLREAGDDTYQIVAGERRYRASLLAGLTSVPAYIKTVNDDEVMEMALVENIQREDLNSIEIALAYQNLIDSLSLTQEQLSERVGKKRATIANYLRLLKLPAEVQMGVKDKKIDMGHARALITVDDPLEQLALYNRILEEGLSVRGIETVVQGNKEKKSGNQAQKGDSLKKNARTPASLTNDFEMLQSHLSAYFKTDVQFNCSKRGKGKITFPFNSTEELERLIVMFDALRK